MDSMLEMLAIYSIGLAFAAYAATESAHGSGFIAAFAAGLRTDRAQLAAPDHVGGVQGNRG